MFILRRPLRAAAFTTGILMMLPALAVGDAPRDHVVGGGQNNPANGLINHFNFNVFGTGVGDAATGKVKFHTPSTGRQFTASISCLRVNGNLASMVGTIEKTKNNDAAEGRAIVIFVQDVGQGNDSDDRIQNSILGAAVPEPPCPPPTIPATMELTHGNINVFDAA